MCNRALNWTFENSPYNGAKRCIHLAIADTVNPKKSYELWMSNENLASRAGCTREVVNRTLKQMAKEGYLARVGEGTTMGQGKNTVRYRFLFPELGNSDEPADRNVTSRQKET